MVKVALTVEGEADDVVAAIRQLAGDKVSPPTVVVADNDAVAAAPIDVAVPPAPVQEGRWTVDHVRTFWGLLAPNAQQVYHRVANSSGYVMSRQSLLDAMGLTERQLGGRMSSVGHSVRRIRNAHNVVLPHPMAFDPTSDDYRMLPDVADAIVRLTLRPSVTEEE